MTVEGCQPHRRAAGLTLHGGRPRQRASRTKGQSSLGRKRHAQNVDFGSASLTGTTSSPALICAVRASILALVSAGILSSNRSEEPTSELQSLIRISYAVFRLKKTNINTIKYN